jgi:hypothetical protein
MTMFISDKDGRVNYSDGWRAVEIDFFSKQHSVEFEIDAEQNLKFYTSSNYGAIQAQPVQIETISFGSKITVGYLCQSASCGMSLYFDWQIAERISLDQTRGFIGLDNPFVGAEIGENRTLAPGYSFLHIDKLIVEMEEQGELDYSRTIPPPTFLKTRELRERSIGPVWVFDNTNPPSSILAVFTDPNANHIKVASAFLSGLFVAFSVSVFVEALKLRGPRGYSQDRRKRDRPDRGRSQKQSDHWRNVRRNRNG